jgi:hypothetical protein
MGAYGDAWKQYRRLKRAFVFSNIGFLGFAIPTLIFASFHEERLANFAFFGLGAAWIVWYAECYEQFRRFRCPRCGQYFSSKWLNLIKLSAKQCLHCGLEKFSNPPE